MKNVKSNNSHDLPTLLFFWFAIFNSLAGAAHSAKEVPVYAVSTLIADELRLPCDISPVEESDHIKDFVVLVLWYKEDKGPTPIYSIDARDKESFKNAKQWSEDITLAGRTQFISQLHPAILSIKNSTVNDEGTYRCRVDFRLAQTRNSKVNVTIIIPPEKVEITDEYGKLKNSVIGPYSEGANVTIRCRVNGGRPKPHLLWYKDKQLISNTSSSTSFNTDHSNNDTLLLTPLQRHVLLLKKRITEGNNSIVDSVITLKQLKRTDLHSRLTCKAVNNEKTFITETVLLDMNLHPLAVYIVDHGRALIAQRTNNIICHSVGSRPPARLTWWWKNARRIDSTKDIISTDGNSTVNTLQIIPSKLDEGAYLACRAENPVFVGKVIETGWHVHINYVPEAKIKLGISLKEDSIVDGMDVYFDCDINALPPIYKSEWRRNNHPLQHNISAGIIISSKSLVLQRVTMNNSGNYSCVGYNDVGEGISSPFYLNVMYKPMCKAHQTRVYGIAKMETANISCEVNANPTDVTFNWVFNSSIGRTDIPQSKIFFQSTHSLISHTPASDSDYGTLFCYATNKIGNQKTPCAFHIIAAAKPDPVTSCTTSNITTTSFSVRCFEGFDGGVPQSFLLEVTDNDTQKSISIVHSQPIFHVNGLHPGTKYQIFVISVNGKGRSKAYRGQVVTPGISLSQIDHKARDNIFVELEHIKKSENYYVEIAGVACLISISLLVIFLIFMHLSDKNCCNCCSKDDGSLSIESAPNGSSLSRSEDSISCKEINASVSFVTENVDEPSPDVVQVAELFSDFHVEEQMISTIERSPMVENLIQNHEINLIYPQYCTLRSNSVYQPCGGESCRERRCFEVVNTNSLPRGGHGKVPRHTSISSWLPSTSIRDEDVISFPCTKQESAV